MDIEYDVIFSDRKTLSLTVERDMSVIVRVPKGTKPERIAQFVEKRRQWIREKQAHPQKYRPPRPIKEFVSGESVLFLGQSYRLDVRDADKETVELAGKFVVCGPRNVDLKERFREWFVEQARVTIPPRAQYHAQSMGVEYGRVTISDMKYRWGSCTPSRNLNFNWRLVKAPMHVIDYVVVHELAHLLEDNHSPRFWQHVKTQISNFETCKMWLRENGKCLADEF